MPIGTVRWFNAVAGFGYIQKDPCMTDIFVYKEAVENAGLKDLHQGQRVTFEITRQRGQESAVNLQAA